MQDAARAVFSFLCHQEASRSWAPGGVPVALCARCLGVYAGAALAAACLLRYRFSPTSLALAIHGVAILQVVVFGLHLVPHGPTVRTLSGHVFAIGTAYYLQLCPVVRWRSREGCCHHPVLPYCIATVASVTILQLLIRLPWRATAVALDVLSLLGLLCLAGLAGATLIALIMDLTGRLARTAT